MAYDSRKTLLAFWPSAASSNRGECSCPYSYTLSTLMRECRNLVGGIQLLKTSLYAFSNHSTICDVEAIDLEAIDIRNSNSRKQPDTCGYNWSCSPKSSASIHEKTISETGRYIYSAGDDLAKCRSCLRLGVGRRACWDQGGWE